MLASQANLTLPDYFAQHFQNRGQTASLKTPPRNRLQKNVPVEYPPPPTPASVDVQSEKSWG